MSDKINKYWYRYLGGKDYRIEIDGTADDIISHIRKLLAKREHFAHFSNSVDVWQDGKFFIREKAFYGWLPNGKYGLKYQYDISTKYWYK